VKVSFKSKLEDASREYKKLNIKIHDFIFHGAASPTVTRQSGIPSGKNV
jgi:hypothetical protein